MMKKDKDGKKAIAETVFALPIPPTVNVLLNPGFTDDTDVKVMPGMFFNVAGLVPGQKLGPDDYENGVYVTLNRGRFVSVRILWSIDAALDLVTKITEVVVRALPPENGAKVKEAFLKSLEDV